MKIYELINLFIAHNKEEDFTILIVANNQLEAEDLAEGYRQDSNLIGSFSVSEIENMEQLENTNFSCDYAITE